MKTTFKVKQALRFICVVVLMSSSSLAQEFTTCESGEVGVFVSMQYTDVNIPAGEVSWDIQDSNGDTLQDFDYLPIGSNFLYESDEICLPEGEIYTFNTYDTGGDGWGLVPGMSFLSVEEIQHLLIIVGMRLQVLEVLNHFLCLL